MSATVIDGKAIAEEIQREVAAKIRARVAQGMRSPGLATILVGDDGASRIYVRNKRRPATPWESFRSTTIWRRTRISSPSWALSMI